MLPGSEIGPGVQSSEVCCLGLCSDDGLCGVAMLWDRTGGSRLWSSQVRRTQDAHPAGALVLLPSDRDSQPSCTRV